MEPYRPLLDIANTDAAAWASRRRNRSKAAARSGDMLVDLDGSDAMRRLPINAKIAFRLWQRLGYDDIVYW